MRSEKTGHTAVADRIKAGDRVQITPGPCDTTVNLYNIFFGLKLAPMGFGVA